MFSIRIFLTLCVFLVSCSSLMKKDKKVEFDLEPPNTRIDKFPVTFNLKGKGTVKTNCAGNSCSPEAAEKMDIKTIKGFVKNGIWEEYIELEDEQTKKKQSYLKWKGSYKNGIREGLWEEFEAKYDNISKKRIVTKKQEGTFKNDVKDGLWTLFFETGEKLKETMYQAGKKHGKEKKFTNTGIQTEEIDFVDDQRDGSYWKKHSSELLECEGSYSKDQKIGTWTEYTTQAKAAGKLKSVIPFSKDKRDGASVFYHEDGVTKLSEGVFKDNYKTGIWKQYYPNGGIESEGNRKPSPLDSGRDIKDQDSLCPSPNPNGRSLNSGEWKTYYRSGDIFSIGHYDDKGIPVRDWKFYYKGKNLRCKGTMSNAIMMQSGELYDKSGNLEGKGNMMLSMFSIDDETDEMKNKVIPALPFTFYKDGKKYLEILPSTKQKGNSNPGDEKEEGRQETTAIEYDGSGAKVGEGPYLFLPTKSYGGYKHGCRTEGGKKVSYMMGRVQTGRIAEMSNCK